MENKNEMLSSVEVTKLSNELTYQRYLFNKESVRRLFRKLTKPEYIALFLNREEEERNHIYSGRTYLKELADKMQVPIRQISKMAGKLKEKGLITWSHDGDGSEGTYVMITETGRKLLAEEELVQKNFYGTVIEKFGKENLAQLLQLMKQLETIMSAEVEGTEEIDEIEGSDADEREDE